MTRYIPICLLSFLWGCAHREPVPPTPPESGALAEPEVVGIALARHGRFMEASAYFETAIARGKDERRVLPMLLASQVYSDCLRAAKQSALRLKELIGEDEALDELLILLTRYTPGVGKENTQEVLP